MKTVDVTGLSHMLLTLDLKDLAYSMSISPVIFSHIYSIGLGPLAPNVLEKNFKSILFTSLKRVAQNIENNGS